MFLQNSAQKNSAHGSHTWTYLSSQSTILYSAFPYILKSFCQVKEILWFYLSIFCSPLFSVFSVYPSFEMHSIFTPFIYSLMFYIFLVHTRIFFKSFFQFTIFSIPVIYFNMIFEFLILLCFVLSYYQILLEKQKVENYSFWLRVQDNR